MTDVFNYDISRATRESGAGDSNTSMVNAFRGTNYNGGRPSVYPNQDHHGLTFFTRPMLNLTYHNMLADERMENYLSGESDSRSLLHAIRCALCPLLNNQSLSDGLGNTESRITSPLVNPKSAFLPLLSNTCVSMSGWPDNTSTPFVSPEGRMKQSWSYAEGHNYDNGARTINATFRRIAGDPVGKMIYLWWLYSLGIHSGQIYSSTNDILHNSIEYMTRIYRFILDSTRRYVQFAACTHLSAYPISDDMGTKANFDADNPNTTEGRDVSVTFQASGILYGSPRIVNDFNETNEMFHGGMIPRILNGEYNAETPLLGVENGTLTRIKPSEFTRYNSEDMYTRINPFTMEIERYMDSDRKAVRDAIFNSGL